MNRRQLKHHFLSVLMALMLTHLPFVFAAKNEQPKQSLDEVQQRLEALKKELDDSKEAHKDAADALKESEVAISEANKKLFEINQKQQKNKKTLSQLQTESATTNQALTQQQKLLNEQLYQQYIHGQQSYLQMILQSENPSEIARDIHYFSYVTKARATLINKMQGNLNKISKLNEEAATTLKEVAELKQKQIEEKKVLEEQKKTKSKVVRSLSNQIATQRGEIKKLSRDEKRLSQLVERLTKIIPSAPKKVRQKTANSGKTTSSAASENVNTAKNMVENNAKASNTSITNNGEPSTEFSGSNFASLKGKLRLPVRGDLTNRFGTSREDSGISWKGLFIKANEGADVKSVATGRVVFADWLRGFGNLIILDHGGGYMSLYGNNQAVFKQVGDNVQAGDTIASVGNSGGNETSGLYYELRRQSHPFDPLSWSRLN
ncbi:peptidoglycan DD-metalloendopeptidase family protein [Methylotenera sp.]|uniref:murein hydrolase activator EnvC family protein n=1 Tax=Methylotenera sp. TaxID=2051956 RepID=UPI0025EE91AD|nr:peptidoglycan DD-metalloendopeptidase family protein [Methylotenera sp.]